jgi:hypothetical protein
MLRLPYPTRRGNIPGFKGVRQIRNTFTAQVHRGGKRFHLGTFPTETQAAIAVNLALGVLFPDLPSRYLNALPEEELPTPEVQESIQQEVILRIAAIESTQRRPLADV